MAMLNNQRVCVLDKSRYYFGVQLNTLQMVSIALVHENFHKLG